jgi:hypothetical protein
MTELASKLRCIWFKIYPNYTLPYYIYTLSVMYRCCGVQCIDVARSYNWNVSGIALCTIWKRMLKRERIKKIGNNNKRILLRSTKRQMNSVIDNTLWTGWLSVNILILCTLAFHVCKAQFFNHFISHTKSCTNFKFMQFLYS